MVFDPSWPIGLSEKLFVDLMISDKIVYWLIRKLFNNTVSTAEV
jgi:hypothetical protein